MAHVKYVHFSVFLSSKMELDRLDFLVTPLLFFFFSSLPALLSTSEMPLQEARVNLGEEMIR